MLAYAANRPAVVDRRPHPNTLLLIIGAHVAVVAAVMSVKMDLPQRIFDPPIKVRLIEIPPDPAPIVPGGKATTRSAQPRIDQPITQIPQPPVDLRPIAPVLPIDPGVIAGGGATVTPVLPKPTVGVTSGAQLLTSEADRKPPYPASKLLNEEEALLTLRLTIDERGRVIAVDPVGRADAAFLQAARRHLIAHWRYKPAMENGRPVNSSTVIRLRFELDG